MEFSISARPRPRDAAFDLAFEQRGIDCAAHVVRGDDLQDLDGPEFDIDLDLRQMRAEPVERMGRTLFIRQRRRRRIVALLRSARSRGRRAAGSTGRCRGGRRPRRCAAVRPQFDIRIFAGIGEPQDFSAQRAPSAAPAARPVTKVWREADVFAAVRREIGVGRYEDRSARHRPAARSPRSA